MSNVDVTPEPIGAGCKGVVFPSNQFPGPPAIGLSIPESWIAIEPSDYVHPSQKIDLAVCGPAPIDGVTPAIVVSVMRTLPIDDPDRMLTELLNRETEQRQSAVIVTSRFQAEPRPSINAVIQDKFPGKVMEHLYILSYVHDDRLAHIISISGVCAAGSEEGRRTIFDIIGPKGN